MKIIVAGATGYVGKAVVAECIANPAIESVNALSRRPIDAKLSENDKVHEVSLKSLEEYPEVVLEQLAGVEACIWWVPELLNVET